MSGEISNAFLLIFFFFSLLLLLLQIIGMYTCNIAGEYRSNIQCTIDGAAVSIDRCGAGREIRLWQTARGLNIFQLYSVRFEKIFVRKTSLPIARNRLGLLSFSCGIKAWRKKKKKLLITWRQKVWHLLTSQQVNFNLLTQFTVWINSTYYFSLLYSSAFT